MTPEEYIKAFPLAMKELCEGRAAVMPIKTEQIINGSSFAPSRYETISQVVSRNLCFRLDK